MSRKVCTCQRASGMGGGAASDDPEFDPNCDQNNPRKVTYADIEAARDRIEGKIIHTPCVKSHLSDLFDMEIYLKQELFQYTGSFKERGACNALLNLPKEKQKFGVIAASAGNHAQALAYHGGLLGVDVTVVMPTAAPIMKVEKCKKYKAHILQVGEDVVASKKEGLRIAREKGLTYINGYDHVDILAGQGTLVLELFEQVKDLDAVVIPVGGGGLIAGCAVAIKHLNPKCKVIGVTPANCISLDASLKAGQPTTVKVTPTLADGLLVAKLGVNSFHTIKDLIDKVVQVKEEHIAVAMLRLIELEKIVAEGAGASALAAVMSGQLDEFKGKKIALVVSGGNVDTTIMRRCLDRGMAAEGRLVKLKCQLSDRPGYVTEFCQTINSIGVCIKDIFHERAWIFADVFSVILKVICETRDYQHALELKALLKSKYENVHFVDFPEGYTPPPLF